MEKKLSTLPSLSWRGYLAFIASCSDSSCIFPRTNGTIHFRVQVSSWHVSCCFSRITSVQGAWIKSIQWFLKYEVLITVCFPWERTEDGRPCNLSLLYLFSSSPPWCQSVLPAFTQTWSLEEHTLARLSCGIIAVTGALRFREPPCLLLLTR